MTYAYRISIVSHNQPVLIGRFMLIFSRRRVDVIDYGFKNIDENTGEFTIDFNAEEWAAQNLQKQVEKQIDVYSTVLINMN